MMRGATAWGPLITPMEDIYRLVYVREPFPAYKLSLVDGSLMSTIVDGEKMKLNTLRFGKLDVLPHAIQLVRREDAKPAKIYDEEAEKPLVGYVRLVGENLLVSRLADDKLRLEGGAGVTEIDTSKVRLIERHEETDGMRVVFTIQMHDGSRLSGSFAERMLSFERAFFMPELFDNNAIEQWQAEGGIEITARALAHARRLLEEYEAPPLDPGIEEALLDFVARREREIPAVEELNQEH